MTGTDDTSMDLTAFQDTACTYFDDERGPIHGWYHVQRVETLADRLRNGCGVDERTVRIAVLLHHSGRAHEDRGKIAGHAAWGARKARRLLAERGVDAERIDGIAHAIAVHRYSNDREPETAAAKVLCDADNLDALGAVGLARCFTYGGERGGASGGQQRCRTHQVQPRSQEAPRPARPDVHRRWAGDCDRTESLHRDVSRPL